MRVHIFEHLLGVHLFFKLGDNFLNIVALVFEHFPEVFVFEVFLQIFGTHVLEIKGFDGGGTGCGFLGAVLGDLLDYLLNVVALFFEHLDEIGVLKLNFEIFEVHVLEIEILGLLAGLFRGLILGLFFDLSVSLFVYLDHLELAV